MTLRDRVNLSLNEVKAWLRIDHDDEDYLIETLMDSAFEYTESFLNNDFISDEGEELEIPTPVKYAVLKIISGMYEHRTDNIKSVNVGDYSVGFGNSESFLDAEKVLWKYRIIPGV